MINMRILAALVGLTAVAWACDYTAFENPNDFAYRYCAVAVCPLVILFLHVTPLTIPRSATR